MSVEEDMLPESDLPFGSPEITPDPTSSPASTSPSN
jgi:hypothetical protein